MLAHNLIEITGVDNISVINSTFLKNDASTSFLASSSVFLSFDNTKCLLQIGGCFKLVNIINRLIDGLTVSGGYSNRTTVGIKIIDQDGKGTQVIKKKCRQINSL